MNPVADRFPTVPYAAKEHRSGGIGGVMRRRFGYDRRRMDEESTPASTRELDVATPPALSGDLPDRLLKGRLYAQLFPSVPPPRARLGRFVLLRELGRGGMGVVLSAYDEQLDRKVAIKLLHADVSRDEAARTRLLREAQALARLSHPNVVQVHEAGVHEGKVFLVMEYVEGRTLRQWIDDEAPEGAGRWRIVLEPMMAAGEGLAAAHAAGLTHRDFKPDNVLVGDDGRVRVADFGLATERADAGSEREDDVTTEEGEPPRTAVTDEGSSPRPLERVTRTGMAVGTVAYMPLEQLRGQVVDARSDQFSFCVTLFEALFGERPFEGKTRAAIEVAHEEGQRTPVDMRAVPRWLRQAVERGLSREPDARFGDMRGLLEAIGQRQRRRRLGVVSAAVLVAAGIGVGASVRGGQGPAVAEPCAEAGRTISETWNPEARARLEAALPPTLASFTGDALDGWAQRWTDTAVDACEQVHVEQIASSESLDVRGRCLDEQRARLGSMLRVLGEEHVRSGPAVVEALGILEAPEGCLLDRGDPLAGLSVEQLEVHDRLMDRLIELDVVQSGVPVAERQVGVQAVYEDAGREGLAEIQRRAAFLLGRLALLTADRHGAERWLGEAIDRAEQLELGDERARAWFRLIESVLFLEMESSRALWIWERAQHVLVPSAGPSRAHALSELARGRIALADDELDMAASRVDAGLAELAALGPSARLDLYRGLRLRTLVATRQGDAELAMELSQRARDVLLLGEGSNDLGVQRYDDGRALMRSGDLAGARRVFAEAIDQIDRELPGSTQLARAYVAASAVEDALGDSEQAQAHAERADAIIREIAGHEDPQRAGALSALGVAAFRQGRFEDSAASFELALRITERQPQPDPVELIDHQVNLAEAREALGQYREAAQLLDRAIPMLLARRGPDHIDLAIPYKARGAVFLALGRAEAAESDLRRALALHERSGESPMEAAETQWLLARCLDVRGHRDEAIEQATSAADRFEKLGEQGDVRGAAVRTWIEERPELE